MIQLQLFRFCVAIHWQTEPLASSVKTLLISCTMKVWMIGVIISTPREVLSAKVQSEKPHPVRCDLAWNDPRHKLKKINCLVFAHWFCSVAFSIAVQRLILWTVAVFMLMSRFGHTGQNRGGFSYLTVMLSIMQAQWKITKYCFTPSLFFTVEVRHSSNNNKKIKNGGKNSNQLGSDLSSLSKY